MLEYNDIRQSGGFTYIYQPISNEQMKDEKQQAAKVTKDL